jgi:deoxyinosine 3'endonuclease (endonuclease V)
MGIERSGPRDAAIFAAVGVAKARLTGPPLDRERTSVERPMVQAAQRDDVLELVSAAFGAELDVM